MSKVVKTGEVTIKYEIRQDLDDGHPPYVYDWKTANGESDRYFVTPEEAEADVIGLDHE